MARASMRRWHSASFRGVGCRSTSLASRGGGEKASSLQTWRHCVAVAMVLVWMGPRDTRTAESMMPPGYITCLSRYFARHICKSTLYIQHISPLQEPRTYASDLDLRSNAFYEVPYGISPAALQHRESNTSTRTSLRKASNHRRRWHSRANANTHN